MTSTLYTLSAGSWPYQGGGGRATTGSANALASTKARFADAMRTLQIRQFWATCTAASQDLGADQIDGTVLGTLATNQPHNVQFETAATPVRTSPWAAVPIHSSAG